MPDVGVDADFERIDTIEHSAEPFEKPNRYRPSSGATRHLPLREKGTTALSRPLSLRERGGEGDPSHRSPLRKPRSQSGRGKIQSHAHFERGQSLTAWMRLTGDGAGSYWQAQSEFGRPGLLAPPDRTRRA